MRYPHFTAPITPTASSASLMRRPRNTELTILTFATPYQRSRRDSSTIRPTTTGRASAHTTLIAVLFQMEQGGLGVLVIFALYVFYGNKLISLISVTILYVLFFTGVGIFAVVPALSLFLLWLYEGKEGKKTKLSRLCFYFAYPIVFVIVGVCTQFL